MLAYLNRFHIMMIAIFAILIMFVFGGGDDRKSKRAKKSSDRLVERIIKHNNKNAGFGGADFLGTRTSRGAQPGYQPGPTNDTGAYERAPGDDGLGGRGYYEQGQFDKPGVYQNSYPPNNIRRQAPRNIAPRDDYYPPPSRKTGPAPGPQSAAPPLPSPSGSYLPDGRPLGFAGTRIFTFDASGKPVPLPDGRYPITEQGEKGYAIVVKNGQKYQPDY